MLSKQQTQNYDYGHSISTSQQFVGEVLPNQGKFGLVAIEVKNKFLLNDQLELMTPQGNVIFQLTEMKNKQGESIDDAKGSGHQVYIKIPTGLSLDYAIIMRFLPELASTRNPFINVQQVD